MWDQLGEFPSPQGDEAASCITRSIISRTYGSDTYHCKKIKLVMDTTRDKSKPHSNYPFYIEAIKLLTEEPPQFSLAAWHMGGEEDYCKRVVNICYEKCVIKKLRLRKLRGIIRTVALIKRLYDDTLERYYMPGGGFETNASSIWNPIMKTDGELGLVKRIKQEVYSNRV